MTITQPNKSRQTDLEGHIRTSSTVKPEGLLRRAGQPRQLSTMTSSASAGVARRMLQPLLRRLSFGWLELVDTNGKSTIYGSLSPDLADSTNQDVAATMVIHDDRAWSAVASEGSIGLGRGYIEQWWDSPNPTAVIQLFIRNLHRLDPIRNKWAMTGGRAADGIRRLLPRTTRSRNKEDIASHYDVGNQFFELFLDETLTYSSAVFPSPKASLTEGSLHKYDRLLGKVQAQSGNLILEIGSGWGGFALRAAEQLNCSVTTTTVSAEQYSEVVSRVANARKDKRLRDGQVTVLEKDWRDLEGQFDCICSIEMIEAVDWRDYGRFFSTIERCLKPDGLVGIQAICVPDHRFDRIKNTEDFIRRFIFPGGFLPSIGAINRAITKSTDLQIVDVEDLSSHYVKTLELWRQRFEDRLEDVKNLGLDDRFCRLWRFYLSYCEAGFSERYCTVNQIVLAGRNWRPDDLALRTY